MSDTRFPRWVFAHGSEPDPRFTLANERTFLAWTRTALALIAGGVALDSVHVPVQAGLKLAAVIVLLGLGLALPLTAWTGWAMAERAMRTERPLPASLPTVALAIGTCTIVVLILAGIAVR